MYLRSRVPNFRNVLFVFIWIGLIVCCDEVWAKWWFNIMTLNILNQFIESIHLIKFSSLNTYEKLTIIHEVMPAYFRYGSKVKPTDD